MTSVLLRREVLPFLARFAALVLAALLCDALLHAFDLVRIGRYLGIPGALLIMGSFGYSLRKRRLISRGSPQRLLRLHEIMAWSGSMLVLVHAGLHWHALLAWLAIGAMLINVASGLVGKFLLDRARRSVAQARQSGVERGLTADALAELLHWDQLVLDALRQWRTVHVPITLVFVVLAVAHIVSVLLFWGWR